MVIRSMAGLFAFTLIAWVISENRRKVDLRVVATGLVLQVFMGTMKPGRRDDIVGLGFRSIVAGTLSTGFRSIVAGIMG